MKNKKYEWNEIKFREKTNKKWWLVNNKKNGKLRIICLCAWVQHNTRPNIFIFKYHKTNIRQSNNKETNNTLMYHIMHKIVSEAYSCFCQT